MQVSCTRRHTRAVGANPPAIQIESLQTIDLEENEAAFSVAVVNFAERGGQPHLVVGTAKDLMMSPRTSSSGFLRVYVIKDEGRTLEFVNKVSSNHRRRWFQLTCHPAEQTATDDVPMALLNFQGHLVAGVGKSLRLYELGKKQLLRKVENAVSLMAHHLVTGADAAALQSFPTAIVSLNAQGSRIVVGDMQESVFYVAYKQVPSRQLLIFADDAQPRWITCTAIVDYETVACGDKFGNIFINRLPHQVSLSVDDDPTGAGILHEKGFLMGAAHKADMLAHYNVGSIVTSYVGRVRLGEPSADAAVRSLTKVPLVAGGREVLCYTTISGAVGALIPFASKDDVEFMQTLEMVCSPRRPPRQLDLTDRTVTAYALGQPLAGWPRPSVIPRLLCTR